MSNTNAGGAKTIMSILRTPAFFVCLGLAVGTALLEHPAYSQETRPTSRPSEDERLRTFRAALDALAEDPNKASLSLPDHPTAEEIALHRAAIRNHPLRKALQLAHDTADRERGSFVAVQARFTEISVLAYLAGIELISEIEIHEKTAPSAAGADSGTPLPKPLLDAYRRLAGLAPDATIPDEWMETIDAVCLRGSMERIPAFFDEFADSPALFRFIREQPIAYAPSFETALTDALNREIDRRSKRATLRAVTRMLAIQRETTAYRGFGGYEHRRPNPAQQSRLQSVVTDFPDLPEAADAREWLAGLSLEVGVSAPEITAADAAGHRVRVADYRGKVLVLDFWDPNAAGADDHVRAAREAVRRLADRPVAVVGVVRSAAPADLAGIERKFELTWRQLAENSTALAWSRKWSVDRWPFLVVIDKKGRVRSIGEDAIAGAAAVNAALAAEPDR